MNETSKQNFEQSLDKLEELVARLEDGDLPLEEAIKLFKDGMGIIKSCSKRLSEVELEVKELVAEGEKVKLEHFELEDDEDSQ